VFFRIRTRTLTSPRVAAHWADLLPHLIPKRMRPHSPGAAGSNALACYRTGQGEFSDGPLGRELALQLKPGQSRNGNIVPASRLTIDRFQLALAATRDEWNSFSVTRILWSTFACWGGFTL
jgi:hypothetical protein